MTLVPCSGFDTIYFILFTEFECEDEDIFIEVQCDISLLLSELIKIKQENILFEIIWVFALSDG